MREFQKYKARGAYHWDAISLSIRKHNPFLVGRYGIVTGFLRASGVRGKLLDIGCGDAALGYLMSREGMEVIGLDYSGSGIGHAVAKFGEKQIPPRFMRGDSCNLPVRDGSFDAVVAADIIEHLKEPEKMLSETRRALKDGGVAIITTPVKLTPVPVDPEHVMEFTEAEFRETLGRYFSDVEITLSHPEDTMKDYERSYRFLGLFGRIRPYKYLYNMMSSMFGINPFLRPAGKGRYTQMSAIARK